MIDKWGERFVLLPCFMGPGSRLMAEKWGARSFARLGSSLAVNLCVSLDPGASTQEMAVFKLQFLLLLQLSMPVNFNVDSQGHGCREVYDALRTWHVSSRKGLAGF
jgi:hypothetical protein